MAAEHQSPSDSISTNSASGVEAPTPALTVSWNAAQSLLEVRCSGVPDLAAVEAHGFLAGYLNLFAEKPEVFVGPENRRIIKCATVHHDAFKMESYQKMFGRRDDGYFNVRSEAERWVREITEN